MATEETAEVFTLKLVRDRLIVDYKFWVAELRDSSKLREATARGPKDRTGYLGLALEQRLTAGHLAANNNRDLIAMIDMCLLDETELEDLPAVHTILEHYTPATKIPWSAIADEAETTLKADYSSPTQKLEVEEDPRFWAEKDGRA